MTGLRVGAITLAASCLLATVVSAAPRPAPPVQVVVTEAAQFVPGHTERPGDPPMVPLVVARGGRLFLFNADVVGAHRLTAYDLDERGDPLFFSHTINSGQAGEVEGVSNLAEGRYAFYCGFHSGMDGVLDVIE